MLGHHRAVVRHLILAAWLFVSSVLLIGPLLSVQASPSAASPAAAPLRGGPPVPNRISQENALPGTDTWGDLGTVDSTRLAAYGGSISVRAGDSINVHVKTTGNMLTTVRLYRMGYYQNHGGRLYQTYNNIPIGAQPN